MFSHGPSALPSQPGKGGGGIQTSRLGRGLEGLRDQVPGSVPHQVCPQLGQTGRGGSHLLSAPGRDEVDVLRLIGQSERHHRVLVPPVLSYLPVERKESRLIAAPADERGDD